MGNSILIWKDNRLNPSPSDRFPHLYSFAKKQKCSLKFFVESEANKNFTLPLSVQASEELASLQVLLQQEVGDQQVWDTWTYRWNSLNFSSNKAYKLLQGTQDSSPLFRWLWTAGNLGKHNFFFWLLLKDRLNTRNLLRRKNKYLEDYSGPICNRGLEETCMHLFLSALSVRIAGPILVLVGT